MSSLITADCAIEARFFQLPKILFNEAFNLSIESKALYSFMLDRLQLSKKNDWVNSNNELFIYYTIKEASKMLGKSEPTTTKFFKELEKENLIKKVRQGLNKPNVIYLKSWILKFLNSRNKETLVQEIKNLKGIDTESNKTEVKKTESNTKNITSFRENDGDLDNISKIIIEEYEKYNGKPHRRVKSNPVWEHFCDLDNEDIRDTVSRFFEENPHPDRYTIDYFKTIEQGVCNGTR